MRYLIITLLIAMVLTGPMANAMANSLDPVDAKPLIQVADEPVTLLDGIDWDEWLDCLLDGIDWDEWFDNLFVPRPDIA